MCQPQCNANSHCVLCVKALTSRPNQTGILTSETLCGSVWGGIIAAAGGAFTHKISGVANTINVTRGSKGLDTQNAMQIHNDIAENSHHIRLTHCM